tara:strand:+ start:128 stop:307 length:180 start_codon:yes stop_codon:yes gene_type:complete
MFALYSIHLTLTCNVFAVVRFEDVISDIFGDIIILKILKNIKYFKKKLILKKKQYIYKK